LIVVMFMAMVVAMVVVMLHVCPFDKMSVLFTRKFSVR